jgi:tetratricopeptide (TPR) repeat protein
MGIRKRIIVGFGLAGLLGALGLGGYAWYERADPVPPTVSSEGLEGAVRDAIDDARVAVQQTPRSPSAWGRLGMVLFAHSFPAAAEDCFMRAEQLDAEDPRWPYYLGAVLSLRDTEAALPSWRRAAALCGAQTDAPALRLAEALLQQGYDEEARSLYQSLLLQDPSHPPAHLGLARLAAGAGNASASIAHLEQCIASPYTRKAAYTLLAEVHERQGDRQAAERALHAAARLPEDMPWPNRFSEELSRARVDQRARLKQATRLLDQGRLDEAVLSLQQLLRDHPDLDIAWRALGYALFQRGDLPGAEQALQRALQLAPESAEARYYMGCVAFARASYATAAAHFRRATELKPDYAMAHYNLGHCLKLQGDRAGAILAFRTAVDCRPYLAEAHRNLGELLSQEGLPAEALVHLRQALALNPADARAQELIRQAQAGTAPSSKPR